MKIFRSEQKDYSGALKNFSGVLEDFLGPLKDFWSTGDFYEVLNDFFGW